MREIAIPVLHGTRRAVVQDMPYASNAELPDRIRKNLPRRAQDIFRAAFNSAYERYGPTDEVRASRIAWAAWVRRPARA
jgi:cation transport regulator